MNDRLEGVQRQVTTVSAELGREVSELRSESSRQRQEIGEIRSELRSLDRDADYAGDMAALRAEMLQLRRQMEVYDSGAERVVSAFPPRELDILTSNIAKLGSRASQVEILQMELEILKGRVDRAETRRPVSEARRVAHGAEPGELPGSPTTTLGTRKRASSSGQHSASKRPALSPGYSGFVGPTYGTPSDRPAHLPRSPHSEGVPESDGGASTANSQLRGRKSVPGGEPIPN